MSGLRRVDLSGNWLDDAAASNLASVLTLDHQQLQELVLSFNRITNTGVAAVATALAQVCVCVFVFLSGAHLASALYQQTRRLAGLLFVHDRNCVCCCSGPIVRNWRVA